MIVKDHLSQTATAYMVFKFFYYQIITEIIDKYTNNYNRNIRTLYFIIPI